MGSITLLMVAADESEAKVLKALGKREKKRAIVGIFRGEIPGENEKLVIPPADAIIKKFDKNASGTLSAEEFPVLPAKERFAKIDRNGDNQADESELKSMVRMMNIMLKYGMREGAGRDWLMKRLLTKN